jgi:hydroxymethylglutaryl-CoA lyase
MSALRSKLPARVSIREVGPREGFQRGVELPTNVKADIINRLIGAGAKSVQAVAFVHPKAVPHWADAEDVLRLVDKRDDVLYDGLVLNARGLERAVAARDGGLPLNSVTFLGGLTDYVLNSNGMPGTVDDDLENRIIPLIKRAKEAGLHVMAGVSAAFGCSREGAVTVERLVEVVEPMVQAGADRIYLSDSTGEAAALQVVETVTRARDEVKARLTVHLHDNRGQAVAAILGLLLEGIHDVDFDTAIGGLGGCPFIEAAGNVATEDVVFMLEGMGVDTGFDLDRLVDVSVRVQALYDFPLAGHVSHYGLPKRFTDLKHETA